MKSRSQINKKRRVIPFLGLSAVTENARSMVSGMEALEKYDHCPEPVIFNVFKDSDLESKKDFRLIRAQSGGTFHGSRFPYD